ncbi:transposase [Microcoleus sp. F4-D5]|uniref:transposase n=1 Tax=Microcoleus sp. F4-D5 TaxID=2818760 RepID=UPI002FD29A0D
MHELTTYLAKTFNLIKIEDLNVLGMMPDRKLAGAISDRGSYEFKRQLDYKCNMYGANLVLVDQWFPLPMPNSPLRNSPPLLLSPHPVKLKVACLTKIGNSESAKDP